MAPVAGRRRIFLFAPWPPRWVRYDLVTNCARLCPIRIFRRARRAPARAFLAARDGHRRRAPSCRSRWKRCRCTFPTRDASVADLLANTVGAAFGGGLAAALRALAAGHALACLGPRPLVPARHRGRSRACVAGDLARRPGEPRHSACSPRCTTARRGPLPSRRPTTSPPRWSSARTARFSCSASGCSWRCSCASGDTSPAPCCC